ncbi:hypothetical protein ASG91_16185 [Phycicoccus sp. Soil802]|nr:hypothetical protein ASG91_16185 [Phycicoccus sp. Soil802]
MADRVPQLFTDGNFETWMSGVAEPQPYLSDEQNADNAALFVAATQALHDILVEREAQALAAPPKPWLLSLMRVLHATRADVITFNYDTLVERAALSAGLFDAEVGSYANMESILDALPPPLTASYAMLAPTPMSSFRLMKLHGSLDTYWVRGDATGSTIGRLRGERNWDGAYPSNFERTKHAPGRQPFLVPPAAAKSAFYDNPITRQLWRNASEALSRADRVAVVGYSLPLTDLVTAGMLREALAGRRVTVDVVNPDAAEVKERLHALGVDGDLPVHTGAECVANYSAFLANRLGLEVLGALEQVDPNLKVSVASRRGIHPVIRAEATPDGVCLNADWGSVIADLSGANYMAAAVTVGKIMSAVERSPGTAGPNILMRGVSTAAISVRLEVCNWATLTPEAYVP